MDYDSLKNSIHGNKTAIVSCGTCARLCNGIGGKESAEKLACSLKKDGIDVTGTITISACCVDGKLLSYYDSPIITDANVIIVLACETGSERLKEIFGKEIVNPIETLGSGYIDANGVPLMNGGVVVLEKMNPFV